MDPLREGGVWAWPMVIGLAIRKPKQAANHLKMMRSHKNDGNSMLLFGFKGVGEGLPVLSCVIVFVVAHSFSGVYIYNIGVHKYKIW